MAPFATLNELASAAATASPSSCPTDRRWRPPFFAIASGATTAPLNPAYRAEEFEFYLSDLNAKALILEEGRESPALAAAPKPGVGLIELMPEPRRGAGAFRLLGDAGHAAAPARTGAKRDDVALVLHTSGTTSRPKIVPLTSANVSASAYNIAAALELSDRTMSALTSCRCFTFTA